MNKGKKATKKTAADKGKKKRKKKTGAMRLKKDTNPAQVRKQVSRIVEAAAVKMTKAVVGEAEKGQLAPVRYLFEMAEIFPAQGNGGQATEEEDCLAKILLARIDAPVKPEKEDEDEPDDAEDEDKKAPSLPASDGGSGAKDEKAQDSVGATTTVT